MIEIVKNDFNEILIRYDNINNQKFVLTKIKNCKLIYDNLNDLLNDLKKCKCLISVDTSFIHLASLLNIPTLSIYFDRHFNPYVWSGKMDNNNSVFISNLKKDCSLIINNFIKQYK
jgi:hypothetical protein